MDFFNNESETLQIGDLTIENRVGRVQIYGSITKDRKGWHSAIALTNLMLAIRERFRDIPNLPDTLLAEGENVEVVENPFTK